MYLQIASQLKQKDDIINKKQAKIKSFSDEISRRKFMETKV